MENSRDPRIQIYANLDNVQDDVEKAAKDRKDEIKSETKEHIKAIKTEMKDLKQEAKDNFEEYKEMKQKTEDLAAKEKIAAAKEASKVVIKNIENDYEQTKERIEKETDNRIESINNMLDKSKD